MAQIDGLLKNHAVLIGLIEWNKDFKVQVWSPEAEKIFGYTVNEALGKSPYDFIIPETIRYHIDVIWDKLLRGDGSAHSINESITKDGRKIVCSWTNIPLKQKDGSIIGVQSIVQDITEHRKHDLMLNRLNDILIMNKTIHKELSLATNERDLLQKICNILVQLKGVSVAWVGLRQSDYTVMPVAWFGIEEKDLVDLNVRWDESKNSGGLMGVAIREMRFVVSEDLLHDSRAAPYKNLSKKKNLRSAIAIPLMYKQELIGAIAIFSDLQEFFNDEVVTLLCEAAEDIAMTIISSRLGIKLQTEANTLKIVRESLNKTIEGIVNITEIRDPYTGGHERGVAKIAIAIAQILGWSEDRIEGLKVMCYLHDVGKIAVPLEILSKPGKLSDEEFSIIKTHPQVGYNILKNINFPWPVAEVVLQHHERMDGSGYPRGLKGEDILFEARILSVSDVVDAICNHRPYRPALGVNKALLEILMHKGTLYDPDVVDACIKFFTEKPRTFDSLDK